MNVGFLGLGKLGLPVALAVESRGHAVFGYDVSETVKSIVEARAIPYREEWAQGHLERSKIEFVGIPDVVRRSDLIFVPIQTPHDPRFEGITPLSDQRADFDYSFLKAGIAALSKEIERQGHDRIVVIASTVLPGTIRREIKPLLGPHTKLCYNPFFIAMGTTMRDFLWPEFILFGVDDDHAATVAERFYRTITHAPFHRTTIENAELIKVVYNTFISTKVAFANIVMEMCHKLPNTNADDVMNALKMGNVRIISDKYLSGGMGDGGGCHPRDNIALSWLSRQLDLSYDWFEHIMRQREVHTEWFADLVQRHRDGRRVLILGKSFKPETSIVTGSPSILLKNILEARGEQVLMWDPYLDGPFEAFAEAHALQDVPVLYFIGTKHPEFLTIPYLKGSTILDPWRYIPDRDGVAVVRIGDSLGTEAAAPHLATYP
jgi:UDPglucose 6-dehydrogenase